MRSWLLFFALLLSTSAMSQVLNPVKWETEYRAISNTEFDLIFKAKLDPHWAVYSQYLESDDGPIPTTFEYDAGEHFQKIGKCEETGERYEGFDPLFDMNVLKYNKHAEFTQRVKVSDLSKPITGYLTFMTCDDERCLPPTDVDFSFSLKAPEKPAGGTAAPEKQTPKPGSTAETQPETPVEVPAAKPSDSGLLDPVKWAFALEQIADQEYDLTFTAEMEKNWSVYSQFTSPDGPVPTAFYFDEGSHYERMGEVKEDGHKKEGPDPLFGGVVVSKFVDGKVVFTQRVKWLDPGTPITGSLEFMCCDNEQCLPPKDVPFSFDSAGGAAAADALAPPAGKYVLDNTPVDYTFNYDWATQGCADEPAPVEEKSSLWVILLLGFGGGLLALLTPCVFPMIPLTVSFFTKSSSNRKRGINNAIWYGLSIIVIYVFLGLVITGVFGADALNLLSTNAWFNIFFAVLFIAFGISFFGYYEITLPSSWANKSDRMADRGGLIGIFFMAFTLSLVSFSCTGPIIGTLLVETATGGGPTLLGRIPAGPMMGMLGFSVALALPFALFAAFPGWLNSMPKSGGWMTGVKVTLGFVEMALALKFFSIADLTMGWKFLPYEAFVALWVLCALLLTLYYLGYVRFPHDGPRKAMTPGKWGLVAASAALTIYLLTGFRYSEQSETFVTPNLLSGLAPPAGHSYIYPKNCPLNINCFKDFEPGLAYAKEQGKPILLDFTGHGCVNCRRMEDNVWGRDGVFELISDKYVLISLYVDDREQLEESYKSPFSGRMMRTVGNKWADFQAIHFNRNSQPYYVLLSNDLKVLNEPRAYTPDVSEYQTFLECGLDRYEAYKNGAGAEPKIGIAE
ncbi:MAG: thioredoxin family protein [Saprospirales bacterium]|nr:thioredoxin family protein [Saprospirales bacterium]